MEDDEKFIKVKRQPRTAARKTRTPNPVASMLGDDDAHGRAQAVKDVDGVRDALARLLGGRVEALYTLVVYGDAGEILRERSMLQPDVERGEGCACVTFRRPGSTAPSRLWLRLSDRVAVLCDGEGGAQ